MFIQEITWAVSHSVVSTTDTRETLAEWPFVIRIRK